MVAVAATFDHQAQVIFAGKIYGCGNILCIPSRDGIDARLGGPCIDPAQGLREAGVIADVKRIPDVLCELLRCGSVRIGFEYRKRKVYRNQISADRIIELLPSRL